MKFSAGFIGVGNMGGALASAVLKSGERVALCDTCTAKTDALCRDFQSAEACDFETLCKNSRFIFLAVKPNVILGVAKKLSGLISPDTVIVTMAAGVTIDDIASVAGTDRIIRIMPNTPAAVGEGTVLYCLGKDASKQDEDDFLSIMKSAGLTDKLPEGLFDAAAALSGCGPAFVYMFAEALADGAVACGLPRDKAELYAATTIKGSAEMLKSSGKHPEKLKDEVCSPGGTTIEGVIALENKKFRAAAASAVVAAYEKTSKLKK